VEPPEQGKVVSLPASVVSTTATFAARPETTSRSIYTRTAEPRPGLPLRRRSSPRPASRVPRPISLPAGNTARTALWPVGETTGIARLDEECDVAGRVIQLVSSKRGPVTC